MEALLRHLLQGLVHQPDQLRITQQQRPGASVWEVHVAAEDFPRVVGRHGRTARALRQIVEASHRGEDRVELVVMDPETGA